MLRPRADRTFTMARSRSPKVESLPTELARRVDLICDRFEDGWATGDRPRIEDFLHALPVPARETLLGELLRLECEYRLRRDEHLVADEYRSRFPEFEGVVRAVFGVTPAPPADARQEPNPQRPPQRDADAVGELESLPPEQPDDLAASPVLTPKSRTTHPNGAEHADMPTGEYAPADVDPAPPPGYEIVCRLGGGGMGVVYKARQVRLNRDVALKCVRPEHRLWPQSLARFHTEGKAIARLLHPHIVQVYDVVEANGVPFLAMEFVDGASLATRISGRPMPPRQAARLAEEIAGAVHYAHCKGVLHRDLKPANILVRRDGAVKVTDFGLAKLTESSPGAFPTEGGLGTPGYTAPEQVNGQLDKIGPRTDVFGLGAVLYEMLTGQPPFPGVDADERLDRARRGNVKPPRGVTHGVPRALEHICLKALAADPARRYATAADLQRALRRFLARRLRWAGGAVAVVLLGVALGGYARIFRPAPREIPLAGELVVRVWDHHGHKPGLAVDQAGALPVTNDDLVHLEVQLNQPAYAYLLWVGASGKTQLLYPSKPNSVAVATPTSVIHSPEELTVGWPVAGPSGMETAILLARTTALPGSVDCVRELSHLPRSPLRNEREVAWLDYGPGTESPPRQRTLFRDLDTSTARVIDDALLHAMARLKPHFELIKVIRFAHRGD